MSFDALKWALGQKVGDGKAKAVLIVLANNANRKSGLAWPSIAELVETSEFDRKTVFRALANLRGRFIDDTGDRRGRTHQVTVWRFRMADPSRSKQPESGTLSDDEKSAGTGTVPETEQFPKPAQKSPGNGTRNQLGELVESPTGLSSANEQAKIFDAWNAMAEANGLPVAQMLTPDRRKHLKARIGEHGVAKILDAIDSIPKSAFLMGRVNGFRANFDFLLRPARLTNLIEGTYADAAAGKPKQLRVNEIPADWQPPTLEAGNPLRRLVDSWSPDRLAQQIEKFRADAARDGVIADINAAWMGRLWQFELEGGA